MAKLSDKKNIPAILLTRITGTQQKLKKIFQLQPKPFILKSRYFIFVWWIFQNTIY